MTTLLLLLVVLAPLVPGTLALGRAFARKERRMAKVAIRWAGVMGLLSLLIVAVSYAHLMGAVATADPSEKTRLLAEGLDVVTPAVRVGAGLAGTLALLGGVARGLSSEAEPRRPGR